MIIWFALKTERKILVGTFILLLLYLFLVASKVESQEIQYLGTNTEECKSLQVLLEIHKQNLRLFEEQRAKYTELNVPPHILHQINGEKEEIEKAENRLRELGYELYPSGTPSTRTDKQSPKIPEETPRIVMPTPNTTEKLPLTGTHSVKDPKSGYSKPSSPKDEPPETKHPTSETAKDFPPSLFSCWKIVSVIIVIVGVFYKWVYQPIIAPIVVEKLKRRMDKSKGDKVQKTSSEESIEQKHQDNQSD